MFCVVRSKCLTFISFVTKKKKKGRKTYKIWYGYGYYCRPHYDFVRAIYMYFNTVHVFVHTSTHRNILVFLKKRSRSRVHFMNYYRLLMVLYIHMICIEQKNLPIYKTHEILWKKVNSELFFPL